ncbi:MAG: YbjN domain-containing protein [Sphingomonadales bacterium 32-68-7]|nr:MAG: YbjN domain-containing protein [Sphingomonadales bacterium 12-68-11]OYX09897.1 MAG: YbjN domain-containing protein [Sphingomonadales bacterium 32-68-7]
MLQSARIALAVLLAAGAAGTARAELVNPSNPQKIVEIVQSRGWPAKLITSRDDDPYIESEHKGLKFLVLFMNCNDDHRQCKTLQYYLGFSDAKDTTLDRLNEWNRTKRFARAYRDETGDPVLEMDLDVDFAGLPRENIGETLNTWSTLMDSFHEFLFD